ncbi:hypothetical protein Tco_0788535 [Tanacetum coccineum]
MAISVILVSSYSSEESMGTSAGRVILFGTIPNTTPTVTPPTTHVDTTLTPTEIPTISPIESDPSEDPSLDRIPLLPAILQFLSLMNDPSNSDTPDIPPSPTHGTPFTEITLSTQISPATSGVLRHLVMILAPGQPIPHGRPYRYHPNRPVHMMTTRKRVGPLPTHRLALRHSIDYSSSYLFTSDDSSRDSPSDSSSETSLDFSDALSDSLFGHSSLDHSSPALPSGMRSSHQSPTIFVPISSPIPGALSPAHADLLPPPKWIRSFDAVADLNDCLDDSSKLSVPRETSLRDDVVVIAEGIDARVVVMTVSLEEVETSARGSVEVRVDSVMHPAVTMPNTRSGSTMTHEAVNELIARQVVEVLETRDAARNLEPLVEGRGE